MDEPIEYPQAHWPGNLDIPLRESEEVVSIDLKNDLPEDPQDLTTLLVEENSDREHWLTIAGSYCNSGKTREGIKLAEQALSHFPDNQSALIHTFLTWAYLRMTKEKDTTVESRNQQLGSAEKHVIEASKQDPTWIGNRLATVELYFQRGMYDRALEYTDIFIKSIQDEDKRTGTLNKPNIMFIMMRAKLMYIKKNYSGALRLFQELLLLNPTLKPDPRIGIGLCFWHLKDRKMAIKAWERSLEISGKDSCSSILVLLGKFHESLNDSDNDEMFKVSFTAAIKDLETLYGEKGSHPVLLALLQLYFYMNNDYGKVISIFEEKIKPSSPIISSTVFSESAFWAGRAYYAQGDFRQSFSLFQEALRKNEDNLLARIGLGQSQIQNNLVEESILTFENLYQYNESLQELNYILGLLYASKCFNKTLKLNPVEKNKLVEKSMQFLEKYVSLTKAKSNQLIITRSYMALSELSEQQHNYKQAIDYLVKALDQLRLKGEDIPLELLNNLGSFYFVSGEIEKAEELFKEAKEKVEQDDLKQISLDFNLSRCLEEKDAKSSESIYSKILSAHPEYISAKIRDLYLKVIHASDSNLSEEVDSFLDNNASNLEVRAFYSWYLKKIGRLGQQKISEHNKQTLIKYDSHDLYALISLANLYVTIGRDQKKGAQNSKEASKSTESYLKATQLYQKVLQIDPFNIFAAQGLAIVFAENKRYGQALEVLRKVRDSLDNQSVHINLGHCLLEMREFTKAIENYELALKRFDNPKSKPLLFNLLARSWYMRGMKEKSLQCLQKALSYVKEALKAEEARIGSKMISSYKFNVALMEFQVAEQMRRSNPKQRTMADLESSVEGLENGISLLKELLKENNGTVPLEQLEQRIQLGETTMRNALERTIEEQKSYEKGITEKLENARRLMEEEREKEAQKEAQLKQEEELKMKKQAEEFKKLQEEAQRLIQERAAQEEIVEDENDNDTLPQDEDGEFKETSKGKSEKRKSSSGSKTLKKRRRTSKKKIVEDDEDVEDEEAELDETQKNGDSNKNKAGPISKEFIEDSDEEANFTEDGANDANDASDASE